MNVPTYYELVNELKKLKLIRTQVLKEGGRNIGVKNTAHFEKHCILEIARVEHISEKAIRCGAAIGAVWAQSGHSRRVASMAAVRTK